MNEEIKIKVYEEISQEEEDFVNGGLIRHNEQFTGKKEFIPINLVIKNKENEVIAGCLSIVVWDWLMINRLWVHKRYRKMGIGQYLLNEVENTAKNKGYRYSQAHSQGDELKDFYAKNRYQMTSYLENRPTGFNYYFMTKNDIQLNDTIDLPSFLNVITTPSLEEVQQVQNLSSQDYKEIVGEKLFKFIYLLARNQADEIVGGLIGYVGWDWFYIDTVWVDEHNRHKGIATNLLKEAEDYVVTLGIKQFFLGTTDFQAKDLYERNGYTVFGKTKDLPIGFTNYSLKKLI